MWKIAAAFLSYLARLAVGKFMANNTPAMVQAATAQGQQVNDDRINELIHQAHFGKTQKERDAAMAEMQKMGAVT